MTFLRGATTTTKEHGSTTSWPSHEEQRPKQKNTDRQVADLTRSNDQYMKNMDQQLTFLWGATTITKKTRNTTKTLKKRGWSTADRLTRSNNQNTKNTEEQLTLVPSGRALYSTKCWGGKHYQRMTTATDHEKQNNSIKSTWYDTFV